MQLWDFIGDLGGVFFTGSARGRPAGAGVEPAGERLVGASFMLAG